MSFTQKSMLAAEKLDRIEIELDGEKLTAIWKNFGKRSETLDPVIEAFRARRSHWEKTPEHDVHIVIEHREDDIILPDGKVKRTYGFSYCPYNRSRVQPEQLHKEYTELLQIIFTELITLFDEWHDADNGMCAFLQEQNKSILDNFLYTMGYKDVAKTKEQRRRDFLAKHPEFKTRTTTKNT